MSFLAALFVGATCALVAGLAYGVRLRLPARLHRHRSSTGAERLWLQQAGAHLTPTQFWAGSIAAGLLAFVVIVAITGTPVVAVVPAIAVGGIPRAFFARKRANRLSEVQVAWPDGLRDVLASVSAAPSRGCG